MPPICRQRHFLVLHRLVRPPHNLPMGHSNKHNPPNHPGYLRHRPPDTATSYAQAVLGILISFVFAGTLGPISYTIISETSSVRLRALSTAVGRAAYYVAEIPMIYLASQMLNTTGWNLAGKCGYVWGGTACVCWMMAYFFLPELKHRSYRESDILFNRKVPARKFKSTIIDARDNE